MDSDIVGTSAGGAPSGPAPPGPSRTIPVNYETLSISEIKDLLKGLSIQHADCVERSDLLARLKQFVDRMGHGPHSAAGAGQQQGRGSGTTPVPPAAGAAASGGGAQWDAARYQKMTSGAAGGGEPATRIKVISVGPSNSGKSCLIKRFCEGRFVPRYISTIGVDYGVKAISRRRYSSTSHQRKRSGGQQMFAHEDIIHSTSTLLGSLTLTGLYRSCRLFRVFVSAVSVSWSSDGAMYTR